MKDILSYYYFTGENIDGDFIEFDTVRAMTDKDAKAFAEGELVEIGGGHIDAFYAETDEFAFNVEI